MPGNADIARFLAKLPAGLAARFDAEQLAAMELHFAMRARVAHGVNWRRRVRLGGWGWYVVVLAGVER